MFPLVCDVFITQSGGSAGVHQAWFPWKFLRKHRGLTPRTGPCTCSEQRCLTSGRKCTPPAAGAREKQFCLSYVSELLAKGCWEKMQPHLSKVRWLKALPVVFKFRQNFNGDDSSCKQNPLETEPFTCLLITRNIKKERK